MFCEAEAVNQVVTEAPMVKKQQKKVKFLKKWNKFFQILTIFFWKIFEIFLSSKTENF